MEMFLFDCILLLLQIAFEYIKSLARIIYPGKKKTVSGDVVLITGAGSGIGRLLSIKFAKLGAQVIGWDINVEGLRETERLVLSEVEEENKDGRPFRFECVDITNREKVYEEAAKIPSVNILINNAGIVSSNKFINEKSDIGIVKTFEVNVFSNFWTVKSFLPEMINKNKGHIVTIASVAGFSGSSRLTDYCASKFAVLGFHESLDFELRAMGLNQSIHTTVVCPYVINTGMFQGTSKNRVDFIIPILEPDYVASRIIQSILLNEKVLIVPRFSALVAALKPLVPFEAWAKMMEAFGADKIFNNLIVRENTLLKK